MSEIERLEGQVRLLKRIIERLPLCPDHRDKVRDVCCWCEMERQQRLTADLLAALKGILESGSFDDDGDLILYHEEPLPGHEDDDYLDPECIEIAREAIAKAEGRD